MAQFTAVITDKIGLHARPATAIISAASKYGSDIQIVSGSKSGNLRSIMNILSMQIKNGDEITIIADGSDAEEAVAGIKEAMIAAALIEG
ncbi:MULTISPECIES: HPr family phosphocarrier protein [Mesoplasma]|uniref:Phosphocarrier protein HPr n=2 Tax=Mesoplasma florum TaxID=2151 RepID=Q6F0Q0_MESFL|nr:MULTISPECIES: HPr family phosphocarrier protein [Mesoplasma]AAT75923.1 phosphotransferase system phosphohistidine-containing protein [Mesoplasma florum L1]AGY41679.1 Phosphotransferase system, phosphocarrier protein HPr [Mesoplasma florum W37]ATI73529.1 HPr family phosphocarrier protein [Mesoplasma florum]ATI74218.1 HPr family phosphocarrier protein [Mesoplasma florum]AVN59174.1 HPr family phosphocarrier protein [Mesoplasma florum]